ncbi:hypothetical protein V2H45_12705 [Tumidithrix elongata RA019]|uniref:DUF4279 domain-containing protein n=1 Tax=Tumidithrix elongata BACA0141 TaxID=2716417 RepID=A0AAW9PX52_9CYAN|nr:hypothetical protein [Tumidithrix elongata RA019]
MAKNQFVLELEIERGQSKEAISTILGVEPNWKSKNWCFAVVRDYDNDDCIEEIIEYEHFDDIPSFVDQFIDLLDGKFEQLAEVGIKKSDIIFWQYYAYDGQCNLEFTPRQLKKLGDNEIRLCISCWDVSAQEEESQE